jgi:hypothetical protein
MESLPFELGPIRPVDEADSLLIRTTRGCPWNNCEVLTAYPGQFDEICHQLRAQVV